MARGGARNRSGPQADPNSGRSDRRGYSLTALPSAGYTGEPPEFPLPKRMVWCEYVIDGQKVRERDEAATQSVHERELELWGWAWSTPQACAWSMPSERWRARTVAMWVRLSVVCESPEVGAAHLAQLHRFADQIGMTTAGLAEMGWKVAVDQLADRAAKKSTPAEEPKQERRLRKAD